MNAVTKHRLRALSKIKLAFRFRALTIDADALENRKFRRRVNPEKGALKEMHLGKHRRTDQGRFRRERADSLVKNLKKEYSVLHDVNGNMKLGTLRDKLGVDSLSQALKKLGPR